MTMSSNVSDNITQCFSVTGDRDYVIITYVKSIKDFDDFLMNAVLAHPSVMSSDSSLVLNRIKNTTILPL